MLGQAIGQAGQSLAQSYGQGLRLKEEKDRYDKEQKQKKKDRKNLKKSYEMQAGIIARGMPELGIDEDDISTMGLGELQGFVEGTKLSQQMEYQGLQLEKIQNDLNQTEAGKNATAFYNDMLTQGLPPMDAAKFAASNTPDLDADGMMKLFQIATAGDELEYKKDLLGLQSARNQTAQRTVDYQESELQFRKQEAENARKRKDKKPVATPVEGLPGAAVVNVGGRDQLVTSADSNDPQEIMNRRSAEVDLNEKISVAYKEADQIATGGGEDLEGGDERTIFLTNRYTRLGKFFSDLRQNATTYKQKYGKDIMPDFYDSVVPLANHMRNQKRDSNDLKKLFQSIGLYTAIRQMEAEGNEKGANKLAEKFGIDRRR